MFFYQEAATGGVLLKKVFLKIHTKTPVSECLIFNKAQDLTSLWKTRLRFRCFAVDSVKLLRTPLGDCCYL